MTDQPTVYVEQPSTNTLGDVALALSLLGWVTCGILCPFGVFLSFFGLLKSPRWTSVWALLIGSAGAVVWLGALLSLGFLAAL